MSVEELFDWDLDEPGVIEILSRKVTSEDLADVLLLEAAGLTVLQDVANNITIIVNRFFIMIVRYWAKGTVKVKKIL